MGIGYGIEQDDYSPEAIMHRVFNGSSAAEWAECYAELAGLGCGPEGDRLRCLFQRLIESLRGMAHVHHGWLVRSDGEPMTPAEIAHLALWDRDLIEGDLAELARAGLMASEVLRGRLAMEDSRT